MAQKYSVATGGKGSGTKISTKSPSTVKLGTGVPKKPTNRK